MAERTYVVIVAGESLQMHRLTASALIARLNENYWGERKVFSASDVANATVDLMAVDGLFIIAGDLVVPQPKKHVTEWTIPGDA